MPDNGYIYIQFFFPFPFKAIGDPLAKVKSATGKLDHGAVKSPYHFFVYQHFVIHDPDTINTDVKTIGHDVQILIFRMDVFNS